MDIPMPLLMVEDDVSMCRSFIDCADRRNDIVFVGMTGSSDEGMRIVKDRLPEGIILDLELNWGRGSGLDFLKEMKTANLPFYPAIVVITRNRSELVSETLHAYGIEWVFCKKKEDYSPDMVIGHLLDLRPFIHIANRGGLPSDLRTLETPEEVRNRLTRRIDTELNIIGIPPGFKGGPYLREAIFLLIGKDKNDSETVFYEIAEKFRNSYNNVIRNMQSAINFAWKNNDIDTLERNYTAHIRGKVGVPSPTEFVHYYANKIRQTM